MKNSLQNADAVEINSKFIETPTKTLADTTKRRRRVIDSQSDGQPSFDSVQLEEQRAHFTEEKLESLRNPSEKESVIDNLGSNLSSSKKLLPNSLVVGYFGMSKDVRRDMTQKEKVLMAKIAAEQDLDIFVAPAIEKTPKDSIEDLVEEAKLLVDYGLKVRNDELKVVPTLDLNSMTPQEVAKFVKIFEEEYSNKEAPIIGVECSYPETHPLQFATLRYNTDRKILTANNPRKIHHERYHDHGGTLSAEVLYALMGADIICQNYSPWYVPDDEDKPLSEIEVDMLNPETLEYEEVDIETEQEIDCGCFMHEEYGDEGIINHFGPQDKEWNAAALHSEISVIKKIDEIREEMEEDNLESWLEKYQLIGDAFEEITPETTELVTAEEG